MARLLRYVSDPATIINAANTQICRCAVDDGMSDARDVRLAIGVAIGIVAALSAGHILRSFLYGVVPYDASTIILVSLMLLACGLLASYIPARRASRIDPIQALRWE